MMKKNLIPAIMMVCCVAVSCSTNENKSAVVKNELRAPAYPLVTIDPYTSGWSMTDNLYDESVKHWTGKNFPLIGAIKVDGQVYRFLGLETVPVETIVNTSEGAGGWKGAYTTEKPADSWTQPGFNDKNWKRGEAAFGTKSEPTVKTPWLTPYIWVRRVVNIDKSLEGRKVYVEFSHDDDVAIYVNGIKAAETGNRTGRGSRVLLSPEIMSSLKVGENVIAAWCYNRVGGALLDVGIVAERPNESLLDQTATQLSADVQATQTHYAFECGPVQLDLHFTAPMFMDNLDLLSRPVNYISYQITSKDGKAHDAEIYFEASSQWALNNPSQGSTVESVNDGGLVMLKAGSTEQKILGKSGDDVRIDWGYFYLAADAKKTKADIASGKDMRTRFMEGTDAVTLQNVLSGDDNNMSLRENFGKVKSGSGYIMIGYDDIYSIQYFGTNLRPYWNRAGDNSIAKQLQLAAAERDALIKKCYEFDYQLMTDAAKAGGQKYADLCALAYRQSISAHKLVEAPNGDLLWLSKENHSNGSIGTVDITYPSAPLYLYYNPELAKGLLNHIYYYSESGKWPKPFPSHDVGTYPLANGQTYGGDMPIEEAGNMVIITAAIAAAEGNAKYAEKHWDVLTTWVDYLAEYGQDPENQLCTDDFAGHFAHNTNLSIKAIMGVACYGRMAEMLGKTDVAQKYTAKAREMAAKWQEMAQDGDHYRLTFDKAGTWSQKYNLVWDKILKLEIFPEEVAQTEIAYYLTKQNMYGLPLDNRETYTKLDWIMWTATLAEDPATFEKFIDPIHRFGNETVDRVPMSDWVFTDKPEWRGFKARSVVGGYFIKMLQLKSDKK